MLCLQLRREEDFDEYDDKEVFSLTEGERIMEKKKTSPEEHAHAHTHTVSEDTFQTEAYIVL